MQKQHESGRAIQIPTIAGEIKDNCAGIQRTHGKGRNKRVVAIVAPNTNREWQEINDRSGMEKA